MFPVGLHDFSLLFLFRYFLLWMDALYLQLYFAVLVGVVLQGVADVERLFRLYVPCLLALSECYSVDDVARLVVDEFQFYVFLLASDYLAGAVVVDAVGAEDGLGVVGYPCEELVAVAQIIVCLYMRIP